MIRFGIDIDGTTTTQDSLLPFINRDFGLNLTLEDIHQYELHPAVNISYEKMHEWFQEHEFEIYQNSQIMENAKEVLNHWYNQYQLYFISARTKRTFETTEFWFQKQELFYHHIELLGSHDKIAAIQAHEIDIFFEDKHDNAVEIAEECKIPVILFDSPYNRMPIPQSVVRVANWYEAKDHVDHWLKNQYFKYN